MKIAILFMGIANSILIIVQFALIKLNFLLKIVKVFLNRHKLKIAWKIVYCHS